MEIEELIAQMKAVKLANDTLTVSEVLKIFEIQALKELTKQMRRIANG